MNNSAFSYLNFIHFSQLNLWDVKRHLLNLDIYNNDNYVLLRDILTNYKVSLNKKDIKQREIHIISKINFSGQLYLRPLEDVDSFKSNLFEIPNESLIYSKINVRHGCTFYNNTGKNIAGTSEYPVFIINKNKVRGEYLQKVLRTSYIKRYLDTKTTGFSKTRVPVDEFLNIKIPLPSLEKQKEIVDRYNEKIKLAEEQKKEAQNLEEEIESYLFKTLDINIINFDTNTNNNFSFIQTINFKNLKAWSFEKNLKDRFEYTARYKLYNLDNLCIKITDGTHQTPKYVNKEGIPFLSAKDVTTQKINWENIKYIPTELHSTLCKRVRPQLNDILLAKNGTTGVAAIVDKNIEFSIYVSLALLRVNNRIIRPNYLLFMINSKIAKMQFNKKLIGIGVPNLHLSEIKTTKIPIPPLEIQDKIICKINEIKAKIEKLNNLAEQNRQLAQEEFEKELFE